MSMFSKVKESLIEHHHTRVAQDKVTAQAFKHVCKGSKGKATAAYAGLAALGHGTDYGMAKLAGTFVSKTAGDILMGLGVANLAYNVPRHYRVINNIQKD